MTTTSIFKRSELVKWIVIAALSALALLTLNRLTGDSRDGPIEPLSAVPHADNHPAYPEEWRRSVDELRRTVQFPVLVPDHPAANRSNLTAAFLRPDRLAVMLDFAPPEDAPSVRQDYIEVFIEPWDDGNPREEYEEQQRLDPIEGREVIDIAGQPALVVYPNSPTDDEQANPAFARTVIGQVEIQVSGGDSLGRIIEIVRGLVERARAPS